LSGSVSGDRVTLRVCRLLSKCRWTRRQVLVHEVGPTPGG
jgi:hypothetical protein